MWTLYLGNNQDSWDLINILYSYNLYSYPKKYLKLKKSWKMARKKPCICKDDKKITKKDEIIKIISAPILQNNIRPNNYRNQSLAQQYMPKNYEEEVFKKIYDEKNDQDENEEKMDEEFAKMQKEELNNQYKDYESRLGQRQKINKLVPPDSRKKEIIDEYKETAEQKAEDDINDYYMKMMQEGGN